MKPEPFVDALSQELYRKAMDRVIGLGEAAKAMMEQDPKTVDEKWPVVRDYYQRSYKVIFANKPTDTQINWLYEQMRTLAENLQREYERGRFELRKFQSRLN